VKVYPLWINTYCNLSTRHVIPNKPWKTFLFDVTGPYAAASIHGNYYQSAMMDTCSAMVYGKLLKNKDEAHDVLSDFFDTEIVALRGGYNRI
jgi:hypothetical protein